MAQGQFGGGTGLINDPLLIEDIADLNQIRLNPHLHYKMKYSVNAGVTPYNEGNGWTPIENFTGTLDGNGKKIFNLYINRPNEDDVGLFRNIEGTNYNGLISGRTTTSYKDIQIYDLGLENVNITGRTNVGGLIGKMYYYVNIYGNGSLSYENPLKRIYVTGTIRGSSAVGGITGLLSIKHDTNGSTYTQYTNYSSDFMRNVYTNVTINATNTNTNYGAIIGRLLTTNGNSLASGRYVSITRYANLLTNAISNSRFTSSINGLIAHSIYGASDNPYVGSITNAYYNKDNWTLNNNAGVTALTTEQMVRSTYLGSIVEEVNDFDLTQRTWTFERGRYPQLYFAVADNLFIKIGNDYYSLDEKGNLVLKFNMIPTREEAVEHGIKDISKVSNDIWNSLRQQYSSVEIVNIVERASNVQNVIVTRRLDLDETNSTNDKLVYRKTISFDEFNDGISLIRTV